MMNLDEELRLTVIDALRSNPMIDSSDIGVAVSDQIATLTGKVAGYYQKSVAEKTASRVSGVRGVAEEMEVSLLGAQRSDTEIAKAAANMLEWDATVPADIKVKVEKGWLTLTGNAKWSYQRQSAERAVRNLTGVTGISNQIEMPHTSSAEAIKSQIEATLKAASERDAKRITVENSAGVVTLNGTVRSWSERNDADRAAWAAPGVLEVQNRIDVGVF